ncbi:hypothetical protein A2774_00570 [Candidatus Roizmanbacteria bacterium RIFCSPHIGHO2_01_FULL_39_12c]|uniref:Uncharacterized protein n=1 Tax=Candidatus Roizmanbacteria bacterium RIFCSPHIGHO2_01_FULL_39_12c TaxID=1802031 RepID=A0A1F7G9Y5_9BACT|nr:MAG: hypothetical protein A2774_00570 [Candidatus Roizmanbacteria bacterium RIFCSPHIGHO2_01_FULL_39_12c]OGK47364.1 MAG: hypothetical protein A2963_04490 [Candidatus Roizmanbacteria bacterium RIFCSPLOWO2_01_FULL_40_13]
MGKKEFHWRIKLISVGSIAVSLLGFTSCSAVNGAEQLMPSLTTPAITYPTPAPTSTLDWGGLPSQIELIKIEDHLKLYGCDAYIGEILYIYWRLSLSDGFGNQCIPATATPEQ